MWGCSLATFFCCIVVFVDVVVLLRMMSTFEGSTVKYLYKSLRARPCYTTEIAIVAVQDTLIATRHVEALDPITKKQQPPIGKVVAYMCFLCGVRIREGKN